MNEFQDFHIDVIHSKMEWMAIKSSYKSAPWGVQEQRNIDALYGFCNVDYDLEAHVLGAKLYFQNKIGFPEIIEALRETCKHSKDYPNKDVFSTLFFNRLKMHLTKVE